MRLVVLGERVKAEDGQDVDVLVVNHEADITQTACRLKSVLGDLAPENQVDEDFCDLLQSL